MLKNEINEILNIHNDEYGIANVITESLIRYYSVNGISHNQFQDNYLNYLKRIFFGRRFHFLDKEKILSFKDQILSAVLPIVRDDLMEKVQSEELFQSSQWQPETLEKVLIELFDNRRILNIVTH
ncbi:MULTISPECIES: hypothetical protein [Dickeya]|uniref:hypothetical protein n=1 Tax=Dickeya TaxID=204037 RepID=UPI00039ECF47|nr:MULTISPECIES: hypothetical protein [Dickeya]UGA50154.1 hypothetical protein QR68_16580 [Dickeya fangzhongdai]UWH06507.1 hypothetical protein K0H75_16580 [Dickeya fangzhongdai]